MDAEGSLTRIYYAGRVGAAHRPAENADVRAPDNRVAARPVSSRAQRAFLCRSVRRSIRTASPATRSICASSLVQRAGRRRRFTTCSSTSASRSTAWELTKQWLAGEGEECLASARAAAMHLISRQEPTAPGCTTRLLAHIPPGPAVAVRNGAGEAASLLVRLHKPPVRRCSPRRPYARSPRFRAHARTAACARCSTGDRGPRVSDRSAVVRAERSNFRNVGLRDVGVGLGDAGRHARI